VAFFFCAIIVKSPQQLGFIPAGWWAKGGESMRGLGLSASVGILLIATQSAFAATFQKIALSGEQSPGAPAGVTFTGFQSPLIDLAGNVAFEATDNAPSSEGIWRFNDGTLSKVVRRGDPTPDRFGTFGAVEQVSMNSAGKLGFWGLWSGLGSRALWSGGSEPLAFVVAGRDPVPGVPNTWFTFDSFPAPPSIDAAGGFAFQSQLQQTGSVTSANDTGIWKSASGSISQILREGDTAPGTEAGVTFANVGSPSSFNPAPRIANGYVAVLANLAGPGITATNDTGIWVGNGSTLARIVREADAAPGGGQLTNVGSDGTGRFAMSLTDAGDVVFLGRVSTNRTGIYISRNGSTDPIVQTGDAAPRTGGSFFAIRSPAATSTGRVAFWANLQHPVSSRGSLWTWSDGELHNVITTADAPPEIGGNWEFGNIAGPDSNEFLLNDRGQMAFIGYIRPKGTIATNTSLWGYDPDSGVHLIARAGDAFEVAPGDIRTISGLSIPINAGTGDGRPNSLNDSGQLAVTFRFTDGSSGVFLTGVPEPSSIALVSIITATLLSSRRRRSPV
jgi:hypothetical protein